MAEYELIPFCGRITVCSETGSITINQSGFQDGDQSVFIPVELIPNLIDMIGFAQRDVLDGSDDE